jgi:P4 family phage/plasmid primase-like protien
MEDGTKRPMMAWKKYQTELPTEADLHQWYREENRTGVGIITGVGGVEMWEVEGRGRDLIPELKTLCHETGLGSLLSDIVNGYCERTPSGGFHTLYRTDSPKTEKLAVNEAGECLIETKGAGGYTIIAPSHGTVHPTGGPWVLTRGALDSMAAITDEERHDFHRMCRTFDARQTTAPVEGASAALTGDDLRPGDVFNASASWPEVLGPHGWTCLHTASDGNQHWRRPGKNRGTSATINKGGTGAFYVFSSSTPFEPDRAYSPFSAYTLLEHGGDYSAAASELARQGYGAPAVITSRASGEITDPADTEGVASDGYRLTDAGNAGRFTHLCGGRVRYVRSWGKYIAYKNGVWLVDPQDAMVTEFAKEVSREMIRGLSQIEDPDRRKREFTHALRTESAGAIASMLRLARGDPGVLVEHEDLDADPHLLNVANGTIDLTSGTMRPHDPADLMTMQCPIAFDPDAEAPLWEDCLKTWQPDPEMQRYLQVRAGACATGRATETADLDHGDGGNGKTKFHAAIQNALGDYAVVPHKSLLVTSRHEQHATVKASLFRKRLALAGETKAADKLDEEQVKALTGGDRIGARRMREDEWWFDPSHTLIIFSNYAPVITGTDEGIWRRVRLVRWPTTIPEAERDKNLDTKLRAEAPGILRWIVDGARIFLTEGLDVPDSVRASTTQYRQDEDVVGRFITESLTLGAGETTAAEIKVALQEWCAEEGRLELRMNDVASALTKAGCQSRRVQREGRKVTIWSGVTLGGDSGPDQEIDREWTPWTASAGSPLENASRVYQRAPGVQGVHCPEIDAESDAESTADDTSVAAFLNAFPGAELVAADPGRST